jgi:hypothetical protein
MAANYSIRNDSGFSYVEIRKGRVDIYDGIQCDACGGDMSVPDGREVVYGSERFISGKAVASGLRCTACNAVHALKYEGI